MNNDLRYYGNPMKWKSVKGDLISRDALKEAIRKRLCISSLKYLTAQEKVIVEEIDNAPAISFIISPDYVTELQNLNKGLIKQLEEAERPQGGWIIIKDERYGDNVKCPFCEKELAGADLNFCCKCGAKLIGSEKMNGGVV